MRHYYCSTFSRGYAYKGLLLYESLLRWDKDFHFFFICLHQEVKELYDKLNLKNATFITLSDIEREDDELLQVKSTRNEKEYAWTSKASAMLYILRNFKQIDHITWLDGDTYFYSTPDPIFDEWGKYSIMLTEERWSGKKEYQKYTKGIYNTGFMGFKRDKNAIQCLDWFRNSLIDWCYDKLENGLWSDQLYVNDWPKRFKNVGVIKNMGVNVGPYIIGISKVTKDNGDIYIDGQKLVFYHSYGFRYYDGNEFDLCSYMMSFSDDVLKWIYLPYIQKCNEVMDRIRTVDEGFYPALRPKQQFIRNYYNVKANEDGKNYPQICTLTTKEYLVQALALYNSLKRNTSRFHLWILCVDLDAYNLLEKMDLANVTIVSLNNILNERLEEIRGERKISEFCWTLKASFITYIIKNNCLGSLLYLDSDLFFFKDVQSIYDEWDKSIFITRLWMGPKWETKVGRFSAGLIGFRRDKAGLKCLTSWRRKCLKWCYDRKENGLWADQKYLDKWPRRTRDIVISSNKGINAGPWNVRKDYALQTIGNKVFFDNDELVCYHFSGFEILGEKEYELCNRKTLPSKGMKIYWIYVQEIRKAIMQISTIDDNFIPSITGQNHRAHLYNHYVLRE